MALVKCWFKGFEAHLCARKGSAHNDSRDASGAPVLEAAEEMQDADV